MKARWLFEVAVTSLGLLALANCAKPIEGGPSAGVGGDGGEDWTGPAASSSSSSGNGGAGGGGSSSSGSSSGNASSSSSSSTSASSSGGGCAESPCKLVSPQCGCAAGQMCTIDGSGTRECVAEGTVQPGQSCALSDCAAGSLCFGANAPICGEMCTSDAQCTGPGGLCVIKLESGGVEIPGLTICSENCDPSSTAGCPAGMGCNVFQETAGQMRFFTACRETGTATQNQACSTSVLCAASYGCFDTGISECLKYCKVANPSCPAGTTCTSVGVTIGSTEYGACL